MNAKMRSRILSLPFARVLCDAVVNVGNKRFARSFPDKSNLLQNAADNRRSSRCFIVGNGPSLALSDLELLKDEDCFAANHIYKLFDKTEWRPRYYVIQDRYTVLDRDLCNMGSEVIFAGSYFLRRANISIPDNLYAFYDKRDLNLNSEFLSFSDDISRYVSVNYTVTYTMIQIAVSLGYRELYLLGIDHAYSIETDNRGRVVKKRNVRNHAFDDVNKETVANIAGMEKAYRSALHYSQSTGNFSIFNATNGGNLEVFDRVFLKEVISC